MGNYERKLQYAIIPVGKRIETRNELLGLNETTVLGDSDEGLRSKRGDAQNAQAVKSNLGPSRAHLKQVSHSAYIYMEFDRTVSISSEMNLLRRNHKLVNLIVHCDRG